MGVLTIMSISLLAEQVRRLEKKVGREGIALAALARIVATNRAIGVSMDGCSLNGQKTYYCAR